MAVKIVALLGVIAMGVAIQFFVLMVGWGLTPKNWVAILGGRAALALPCLVVEEDNGRGG